MEVPKVIDGAHVTTFAVIDNSVASTGRTAHWIDGKKVGSVAGLAIARYDRDGEFYLFYCDAQWQVLTDTCHFTEDLARAQAEFEYAGVSVCWQTCDSNECVL